jgi:CRP-like cAMP-binding protein
MGSHQEVTMKREPGSAPGIFVASEFFAKEPQRRAAEAMRRDHTQYIALFKKSPEDRSEDEVRQVGKIIVDAPWFAQNFARLRSDGTTDVDQARDLARSMVLVTYEPLGSELSLLCSKGEPVESFDVIVNGSVQMTDDPLVMTDVAGSRAQVLHGGQWFGSEALVPPDPLASGVVNASSSNVRSTGVRLTLLRLLRTDHMRLLEVQKMRQRQLYADILSSLPMLKHYSCRGRTELAAAFSHASFADSEVVVENAATSKSFYVLMQGSVKVRKTLSVAPGLSYPVELKVLQEGDIFGGDRFSTRAPVFENLSFVAQGSIKCMQLSPDHRLLDARARQLILEEFIALPDEELLLKAFDQQSGWEHEKTEVIKHEFKKAIDRSSRGTSTRSTAFARPLSRDTFTRSSIYIPTGTVKQHGEFRPAVSWRHGRNGKHMAETDSQFAHRQALVGTTRQEWEKRLSKCPGSRESIRPRRVASVPLAKSSADVFAETFMTQAGPERSKSVEKMRRPPRPITPNGTLFLVLLMLAISAAQIPCVVLMTRRRWQILAQGG